MAEDRMKIAVIAGEASGDLLGADLLGALRPLVGDFELIGVGGDRLEAEGLKSLFDYTELSIMGYTSILARLPQLWSRVRQTAKAIIEAKPDLLLIIDSPVFTHQVAKRVRKALPDLPVVQYVCPSVWAWKEYRAARMTAYVDLVLALLPFEPEVMQRLGGPETVYVGHRLANDPELREIREIRKNRVLASPRTILLLPGSRASEIKRIAPYMEEAVVEIERRHPGTRFLLPAVPRQAKLIEELVSNWKVKPDWSADKEFKRKAFIEADSALATSGTVVLELALAGVPVISIYKSDFVTLFAAHYIRIWTAALPNLIADYVVVPEYINESLRDGRLARWAVRLSDPISPQRETMMSGYEEIWKKMERDVPAGEAAARAVADLLNKKKAG